jgi:hypothetical protein
MASLFKLVDINLAMSTIKHELIGLSVENRIFQCIGQNIIGINPNMRR